MMPSRRNQYWLPSVFNDLFEDDFTRANMMNFNHSIPAVNIIENERDFVVELAAPGLSKDDFSVNVNHNDELVIEMHKSGETSQDKPQGKYLRREFAYGTFRQSFSLPENIDKKGISAKMENGVLTILIPKMDEQRKAETLHTIAIE